MRYSDDEVRSLVDVAMSNTSLQDMPKAMGIPGCTGQVVADVLPILLDNWYVFQVGSTIDVLWCCWSYAMLLGRDRFEQVADGKWWTHIWKENKPISMAYGTMLPCKWRELHVMDCGGVSIIHGPCFACKIRDRTNEVDRSILLCYVEWVKILWRIGTLAAWEKIPPEKWDCMFFAWFAYIRTYWFKMIWMQATATTPLISHVWFRASDFLNQVFVHESWIFKMLPFFTPLQIPW